MALMGEHCRCPAPRDGRSTIAAKCSAIVPKQRVIDWLTSRKSHPIRLRLNHVAVSTLTSCSLPQRIGNAVYPLCHLLLAGNACTTPIPTLATFHSTSCSPATTQQSIQHKHSDNGARIQAQGHFFAQSQEWRQARGGSRGR